PEHLLIQNAGGCRLRQRGESDAGATGEPSAKPSMLHAANASVRPRESTRAQDAEMPNHKLEQLIFDNSPRYRSHPGVDVHAVVAFWFAVPRARARVWSCAQPGAQPNGGAPTVRD